MLKVDKTKYDKRLALKCISNKELAEATGLNVMTISRLANGQTVPRPATIRKITKVLDCEPADILEEVDE